jgi:sugar phosphate isomerase/epimerase
MMYSARVRTLVGASQPAQEGLMNSPISRRTFLETATCAGALVLAARPAQAADGMYVSLNGSLTPGVSGADKARLAAKLGYGGVDWDLGPARKAGLEETRALFTELKIKPTIVSLPLQGPFAGDDAEFTPKLTQLADDAAFVAGVGCTKMMLVLTPTSALPKEEQRKIVVARLKAISQVLQKSHIRLGLEFLGPLYMRTGPGRGGEPRQPFIFTLTETVALAKDSGPNIGVILDVWHWHHSGSTIADILATDKSRIVHIHISDAKAAPAEEVRDNQRHMPGEGIIDLVAFLQALKKVGYQDGISPEPLGRIPKEMPPEESAKLALDMTLAVMKKAGVI